MTDKPAPPPPSGLGVRGRAVWRSITTEVDAAAWELDERELALLLLACRQSDDLARLEAAIKKHGTMVRGSTNQIVVNPAVGEARQARLSVSRLLGQIGLPDDSGVSRTQASKRGQRAAQSRYDQIGARRARRNDGAA